nr:GLPGLI family protein [uncultured Carboxylicivirga sp.]
MKQTYKQYLLFSLLVILSLSLGAQTNNGVKIINPSIFFASYNYEYQEDSASINSRRQEEMWLLIGKDLSQFAHNSMFRMDSMFYNCNDINDPKNMMKIGQQLRGDKFSYLTSYRIIKSNNKLTTDSYEVISNTYYKLSEEITFDWKLTNKPDTLISNFLCKEAQTTYRGRKYNAWYSVSIPINDGPYKFRGLPGLIVKVEDVEKEHSFSLTSFEKISYNKPITLWDRKFSDAEPEQYSKLKHNQTLDNLRKYGNPQVVNLSQDKLGSVEAKILSRNNLIEKY